MSQRNRAPSSRKSTENEQFRAWREAHRLNALECGTLFGVGRSAIFNWERPGYRIPAHARILQAVIDRLGEPYIRERLAEGGGK